MSKTTPELKLFSVCYRPPFSQGMDTFIIDHVTSSMVSPHKGTLDERETEHYLPTSPINPKQHTSTP